MCQTLAENRVFFFNLKGFIRNFISGCLPKNISISVLFSIFVDFLFIIGFSPVKLVRNQVIFSIKNHIKLIIRFFVVL